MVSKSTAGSGKSLLVHKPKPSPKFLQFSGGDADVQRVNTFIKSLEQRGLARTNSPISKPRPKAGPARCLVHKKPQFNACWLQINRIISGSWRGGTDLKLSSKAGYFPFSEFWGWGAPMEEHWQLEDPTWRRKTTQGLSFFHLWRQRQLSTGWPGFKVGKAGL